MFVTKECCLTFLANPLGDLERRGIAGTSQPQLNVIVNIRAREGSHLEMSLASPAPPYRCRRLPERIACAFAPKRCLRSCRWRKPGCQPGEAGECTCSGRTPRATKRAVTPCSHGSALINCTARGTLRSRLAESSATLMILF